MPLRALLLSMFTVSLLVGCEKGGGGGNTGGGQGGGGSGATGGGSGGTSTLTLTWNFDGRTCAQQGEWASDAGIPTLTTLTIELNGQPVPSSGGFNCADGSATLAGLADGDTSVTVHGWSAQGEELFRGDGSTTIAGATSATVTLTALKGGLAFKWYFWNGASYVDCADAGVSTVTVNLKSSTGEFLFGDAGTDLSCVSSRGEGLELPWLAPGRYFIYLRARDTNNALYGSDPFSPARADVDAGSYPKLENVLQPVELYPQ